MIIGAKQAVVLALAAAGPFSGLAAQDAPADPAGWAFAGPAFVAVSVSDLDRSVAWYSSVFGLETVREFEAPDGSVRGRLLRSEDVVVELIASADPIPRDPAFPDAPGYRFLGLFKSGFFVDHIDAFHAALSDRSIDVDERVVTDEVLGWRMFVFRDPDGNRLQAFQR